MAPTLLHDTDGGGSTDGKTVSEIKIKKEAKRGVSTAYSQI